MLVVRETDAEFRNEHPALAQGIVNVAETGEQPAGGVFRTVVDVTVRANSRRGPFTGKELFTMTGQTGGMLGKITDVRKGGVAFAHFFPILRGNFVARTASQLLRDGMSLVRELCVINPRFL